MKYFQIPLNIIHQIFQFTLKIIIKRYFKESAKLIYLIEQTHMKKKDQKVKALIEWLHSLSLF